MRSTTPVRVLEAGAAKSGREERGFYGRRQTGFAEAMSSPGMSMNADCFILQRPAHRSVLVRVDSLLVDVLTDSPTLPACPAAPFAAHNHGRRTLYDELCDINGPVGCDPNTSDSGLRPIPRCDPFRT